MKLTTILFICTAIIYGSVLFSDDFEDGNADGWTELSTGTYFVSGGWYHMVNSQLEDCTAGSWNGDQSGSMSVADYSLLIEIYPRDGQSGPMVRYDTTTSSGYWLVIDPSQDLAGLVYTSGSSGPTVLTTTSISLSYLDYYWMRIEVFGNMIGGKVWQGTPADEPASWLLTASDGILTDPGSICLYAHDGEPGGTATVHNDYDNVEVTDDLTLPLQGTSWGYIKTLL